MSQGGRSATEAGDRAAALPLSARPEAKARASTATTVSGAAPGRSSPSASQARTSNEIATSPVRRSASSCAPTCRCAPSSSKGRRSSAVTIVASQTTTRSSTMWTSSTRLSTLQQTTSTTRSPATTLRSTVSASMESRKIADAVGRSRDATRSRMTRCFSSRREGPYSSESGWTTSKSSHVDVASRSDGSSRACHAFEKR
mmetsp:Transcript_10759/g.37088  ORF Transcript_10759/g.37088 Transcript_10759/m.37088 type:complete len:200 (-) Transcript_10759:91-690(-)